MRKHLLFLTIVLFITSCREKIEQNKNREYSELTTVESMPTRVQNSQKSVLTEGQIFASENEMLMSLQGSWIWENNPMRPQDKLIPQFIPEGTSYAYDFFYDYGRYNDALMIMYLVDTVLEKGSMIRANHILDMDMNQLTFDLTNNQLTVHSYFIDYTITFHFLSKESFWLEEAGLYVSLGVYFIDTNGWTYGWGSLENGDIPETIDQVKVRIQKEERQAKERDSVPFSLIHANHAGRDYVYVKVAGFDLDQHFNTLDSDGNILMTASEVRSGGHSLPLAGALQ